MVDGFIKFGNIQMPQKIDENIHYRKYAFLVLKFRYFSSTYIMRM